MIVLHSVSTPPIAYGSDSVWKHVSWCVEVPKVCSPSVWNKHPKAPRRTKCFTPFQNHPLNRQSTNLMMKHVFFCSRPWCTSGLCGDRQCKCIVNKKRGTRSLKVTESDLTSMPDGNECQGPCLRHCGGYNVWPIVALILLITLAFSLVCHVVQYRRRREAQYTDDACPSWAWVCTSDATTHTECESKCTNWTD